MKHPKFLFFGAILMASLHVQVWADGVATVISEGQETKIEFVDNKFLRMDAPEGQGYMLMRDKKLYSVSTEGGNLIVIDMVKVINVMKGFSQQGGFWDENIAKINSFKPTGKTEYVAGIRGEIFELVTSDKNGKKEESTLVLTTNKTVIELTRTMFAMSEILFTAASDKPSKALLEMKKHTINGGKGILRKGNEFTIAAIESGRVEAARFELPAEPMELPSMGDFTSAFQSGNVKSGNVKSEIKIDDKQENNAAEDYVDRKADRQKKRAEGKADRAVDRTTDKAVDKVVDKVFGKFF